MQALCIVNPWFQKERLYRIQEVSFLHDLFNVLTQALEGVLETEIPDLDL